MIRLALRASLACLLVLAACSKNPEQTYQGWIEANLIFVSPDEMGRIETQPVREGDQVEPKTLLFTLDDDLQRAEVAEREATLEERQAGLQARRHAVEDRRRHAEILRGGRSRHAHGAGAAQFLADQARAAQGLQPGRGHGAADLFPRRRDRSRGPAGRRDPAARQHEGALLRQRGDAAAHRARRDHQYPVRRLPERPDRAHQLHRPHRRVHAAGDLQPGGAQQARVHDRSAAGEARGAAGRAAGHRDAGAQGAFKERPK